MMVLMTGIVTAMPPHAGEHIVHQGCSCNQEHQAATDQPFDFIESGKGQHQPGEEGADAGDEEGERERPGGFATLTA